jgi:hypothetical protein
MDFTEFLAREYDDIRMPVDALKVRAFKNNIKGEFVFVPVFQSFIYPTNPDNPWSIIPETAGGPQMIIGSPKQPEALLRNSEVGARISFYLSGFDVSVSSLYTWNKMPAFRTSLSAGLDTTLLVPEHHRLAMTGIDFSKPLGSLVVRGEGAFFSGELIPTKMEGLSNHLKASSVVRYLVGIDWYPGYDWTVTGQFSHTAILGFDHMLEGEQHHLLATLGISKNVLRSTLSLSTFGYVDLSYQGYFNRTSLEYSLSDQIRLAAGIDLFGGDGGMFGMYQDNSEVWIKVKYSF